jgi:hypothetical protein
MSKSNITKQLQKAVKQTIDPIFEELQEQYEASRFHRQMAAYRNRIIEQSKPVTNEKLLQMQ